MPRHCLLACARKSPGAQPAAADSLLTHFGRTDHGVRLLRGGYGGNLRVSEVVSACRHDNTPEAQLARIEFKR